MTASHLVTSLDGDAPVLNPPAYPSTGVRPVLFQALHKCYVSDPVAIRRWFGPSHLVQDAAGRSIQHQWPVASLAQ